MRWSARRQAGYEKARAPRRPSSRPHGAGWTEHVRRMVKKDARLNTITFILYTAQPAKGRGRLALSQAPPVPLKADGDRRPAEAVREEQEEGGHRPRGRRRGSPEGPGIPEHLCANSVRERAGGGARLRRAKVPEDLQERSGRSTGPTWREHNRIGAPDSAIPATAEELLSRPMALSTRTQPTTKLLETLGRGRGQRYEVVMKTNDSHGLRLLSAHFIFGRDGAPAGVKASGDIRGASGWRKR